MKYTIDVPEITSCNNCPCYNQEFMYCSIIIFTNAFCLDEVSYNLNCPIPEIANKNKIDIFKKGNK